MELQGLDITIREANDKIRHLENLKKAKEDERDVTFEKTQPKSSPMSGERVQGGAIRSDKFADYLIECEEPKYIELCKEIEVIKGLIDIWCEYVENELKRIGEYEPLKAKIIELKDKKGKTWDEVFEYIQGKYSISQCRRIYKDYTGRRYIDNVKDEQQMNR
jgi:hypothetical protein